MKIIGMDGRLQACITRILTLAGMIATAACSSGNGHASTQAVATPKPSAPKVEFNADSAFSYIARQVSFGPRVPGSQASEDCGDWIAAKLAEMDMKDIVQQRGTVTAWNGDRLNIRNISASLNPGAPQRVLLLGHWDSRPWADQEEDPALREKPIDGANDGASAIGVILEILRCLKQAGSQAGVDVLFVDAEDYGRRADYPDADADETSWCLGTQHWIKNPTLSTEEISYAILLDMVGGKDAIFTREYYSEQYAKAFNDRIWRTAAASGFADRFADNIGTAVIDDHIFLLSAGIPAIDIIETQRPSGFGFNPAWHTHNDNIENIDRNTLKAVGQTVLDAVTN